jgi:hypothetical protein
VNILIDRRQIKNWLCEDCTFVFQTFGKIERGRSKSYYCPNCGDNVAVSEYIADRVNKKRVYQLWTDEEMKVIEQVIKGELLKYQAAIKLGRSIKSVRRKIERLNEERGLN